MKSIIKLIITAPLFLLLTSCTISGGSGNQQQELNTIYMISETRGALRSTDSGRSWDTFSGGLPGTAEPLRFYSSSSEKGISAIYLTTIESGIFRLNRRKGRWESLNNEPFRSGREFKADNLYRRVSAFTADDLNPERLFAATKHTLYESKDGGQSWERFRVNGLNPRNYITSIAVWGDSIAIGTAFNGVYIRTKGEFERKSRGIYSEPYSANHAFTEEISALAFGKQPGTIYAGTNFGKGIYVTRNSGDFWRKIKDPETGYPVSDDHLAETADIVLSGDNILFSYGESIYLLKSGGGIQKIDPPQEYTETVEELYPASVLVPAGALTPDGTLTPVAMGVNRYPPDMKNLKADNRKAIYVPLSMMKDPDKIIRIIRSSGFDSAVIDMKDDAGNIYFKASRPEASEIGAQMPRKEAAETIRRLRAEGIYLIARVVVFKDPRLFHGFDNRYAIRNRETGAPWRGLPKEFWVDPYSVFVHEYNINLSKDIEALGFDEIQFDYIRFPSDGQIDLCDFTFRQNENAYKSEPVVDFLYRAGEALSVPVSVDIYGFNAWYRGGNWIGQDIEEFARAAEIICPMVYPSHFGNRFYDRYDHGVRAERIIYDGGLRSVRIVRNRTVVRPYLQAFRILAPAWGTGYIRGQADGALNSGCGGFTFWNARGVYDIIPRSFQDNP